MDGLFGSQFEGETPPVIILDGGSGTTLTDEMGITLPTSLWSAGLLLNQPASLSSLHRSWEQAGAQIILAASYQATLDGIKSILSSSQNTDQSSIDQTSLSILRSSIPLVKQSLQLKTTKVALSLGPFGATLVPGQEYTGSYPSPYDQEDTLTEFHLNRLMDYASDQKTWEMIDLVLFETIPNLKECIAIRRAWTQLNQTFMKRSSSSSKSIEQSWIKPWTLSFVFIGSRAELPTGEPRTEIIKSVLESRSELLKPDGIGINCTKLEHLEPIISDWLSVYQNQMIPIWLWLYPDGGPIYDSITKTWSGSQISIESWAIELIRLTRTYQNKFKGIVIGGCCKAGTNHIKALRDQLSVNQINSKKQDTHIS